MCTGRVGAHACPQSEGGIEDTYRKLQAVKDTFDLRSEELRAMQDELAAARQLVADVTERRDFGQSFEDTRNKRQDDLDDTFEQKLKADRKLMSVRCSPSPVCASHVWPLSLWLWHRIVAGSALSADS